MVSFASGDQAAIALPGSNSGMVRRELQWIAWRQGAQERMTPSERLGLLARKAEERALGIGLGYSF